MTDMFICLKSVREERDMFFFLWRVKQILNMSSMFFSKYIFKDAIDMWQWVMSDGAEESRTVLCI